ncbi:MAG: Rieske 2Fe-2S domain-containing protein [Sphingobacteriaceae bacterium]|nr:Rieske 2Fe-2S domain-containing protein [Sphingobacteriaceae bacterium]
MYHWLKIYDSFEALENNVLADKTEVLVLKGERVCIAKGKGAFYAVQEKCPHNGASLQQGFCTGEEKLFVRYTVINSILRPEKQQPGAVLH